MKIKKEIENYYGTGIEHGRLGRGSFQLEYARTQEIILRHIGKAPEKILDVGGGTGAYSFWLSALGHEVHLIDPVPVNIEKAREELASSAHPPASISVGAAADLQFDNDRFDVVLMLGPLYHLTERSERLKALAEGKRVLKRGGILFGAAISKYASLIDGFLHDFIRDPAFMEIMKQDLIDGQHRNPTKNPLYFTTAYFHHPDELRAEVEEAGFLLEAIYPLESFGSLLPDFDKKWADVSFRELILETIRSLENDETITGLTSHLLAVGRKK